MGRILSLIALLAISTCVLATAQVPVTQPESIVQVEVPVQTVQQTQPVIQQTQPVIQQTQVLPQAQPIPQVQTIQQTQPTMIPSAGVTFIPQFIPQYQVTPQAPELNTMFEQGVPNAQQKSTNDFFGYGLHKVLGRRAPHHRYVICFDEPRHHHRHHHCDCGNDCQCSDSLECSSGDCGCPCSNGARHEPHRREFDFEEDNRFYGPYSPEYGRDRNDIEIGELDDFGFGPRHQCHHTCGKRRHVRECIEVEVECARRHEYCEDRFDRDEDHCCAHRVHRAPPTPIYVIDHSRHHHHCDECSDDYCESCDFGRNGLNRNHRQRDEEEFIRDIPRDFEGRF